MPWPPYSTGKVRPKNPPSYSVRCHAGWASQYSSVVDDEPRCGLLSSSHARSRSRNSCSSGESAKSIGLTDSRVREDASEVGADAAEDVDGEQRPPKVDVGEALPRVADATVDLDGDL